ncbi:hypothetical protein COTS27_00761 [Spirochaetota bacterium]|nr:hypothetical protein COTS27_00761 [Spirochaetota bacterium]
MNLIKQLKNITAHLIHLGAIALIHSLSQQFKKLLGILNTNTGELTPATRPQFPCKFSKKYKHRQPLLLKQSLLILSSFVLIISCAPSSDTTTTPPDNPTRLATLIKDSNPSISGLSIATDNSDPANPKLTITGITNNSNTAPVTATITIDQSKGITTDPTSFIVTADNPISPYSTNTALTVTFEGEVAVSYTVTTQISGAAINSWIATDRTGDYITVSFGNQPSTLSVTDRTLSITGLTNIPGAEAGAITFENLPAGFTVEPSSITLPNPDGTESATITAEPNTFTITETDNTGNSETYTIAPIELAKLTRFLPSEHIMITESGTDITRSLMITEEAGNMIRIRGLTNKRGANEYTLTIAQVDDLFTTVPAGILTRTILEPAADFSPGPASAIRPPTPIQITNNGETAVTEYTLVVDFSGAAVRDWFESGLNSYLTAASFAGQTADIRLTVGNQIANRIALAGMSDITNVSDGTISFTTALPTGFSLLTNQLKDPDGPELAAITDGDAGKITIAENNNPTNKLDYPVTISLKVYRSPLTAANITATYDSTNATSGITIDTNMIMISSGFMNGISAADNNGMVEINPIPDGYTITPSSLNIPNPEGVSSTNEMIGMFMLTKDGSGSTVPHPVTVAFLGTTLLSITGDDVTDNTAVRSGDTITISTTACQLLDAPTITVVGVPGGKVADATPFPLYYDRERDTPDANGFSVTRKLTLLNSSDENDVLNSNFQITLNYFSACNSFATVGGVTGTGAMDNPYLIDNAARLDLMSHLVNNSNDMTGGSTTYGASHYKITADIDMGLRGLPFSKTGSQTPDGSDVLGKGFFPIGNNVNAAQHSFKGMFDCASNTISNLYINRTTNQIGLVGWSAGGAIIKDCRLTDVNITGTLSVGGLVGLNSVSTISDSHVIGGTVIGTGDNVGGLAGLNAGSRGDSFSTISNSYAIVNVTGTSFVGGLVGGNTRSSIIINSYAMSTVKGNTNVGGLLGGNIIGAKINNSYAVGTVVGTNNYVGGLAGLNSGSSISNSYANVNVTGAKHAGGLVGYNFVNTGTTSTITHSYAIGSVTGTTATNIGRFIGLNGEISGDISTAAILGVTNSYFNSGSTLTMGSSTTGVGSDGDTTATTTTGLTGRSTADLQVVKGTTSGETYFTWDSNIWNFTTGKYPRLKNVVCANRQYNQAATDCTSTLQ